MSHVNEEQPQRKRRVRYSGKHPRRFEEKYKELNPEKYPSDIQKIIKSGHTPAGMHLPVLVNSVLEALQPKPAETGLDATLGFGGHTRKLLEKIRPGGRLFAIDADPIEIVRTEARFRAEGFLEQELIIRRLNFAGIPKLIREAGGGFDFILADLGVSSMQLDNPERGFTFKREGPLDLRLNPRRGQPAFVLLKSMTEEFLVKMLRSHSDEPHALLLGKVIFQKKDEITTTTALRDIVQAALAASPKNSEEDITRSVRRTFQAFRILVNDEFSALEQFLRNLPMCLKPGGRAAILSFHSGEDHRVRESFQKGLEAGVYIDIAREPIRPDSLECYDNPRAKSAMLRWAVKSDNDNEENFK